MREKIPCAVAGTGRIGSSLEDDVKREKPATHAGAISNHPETRLLCGCDTDREPLETFGRRWKLPGNKLYSSLDEMLRTEKIGILHIATDTESHISNLTTALHHSVPVIVLEKPVAADIAEGNRIIPEIKESDSRIIVNHERRFSTDYIYTRRIIEEKLYGPLLSISSRLYLGKTKRVKDLLWHDGTHLIDIIRYLTQKDLTPVHIQGNPWSNNGNVFLIGSCGTVSVLVECSPGRDHLQFELDLSFESGRLVIGNGIFREEESRVSPFYEAYRSLLPVKKPGFLPGSPSGYFSNMMAHAVEVYKDPGISVRSGFEDGLASIRTIQAFLNMSDHRETELRTE